MIRSPQNSHSHSAQGSSVSDHHSVNNPRHSIHPFLHAQLLPSLLQVRQNSSSPTSLSFGDHTMHPKQLAIKCVQVRMRLFAPSCQNRLPFLSSYYLIVYAENVLQINSVWCCYFSAFQTDLTGLKLAALESNKNLDLEKKEGRIDDLLRVRKWQAVIYCCDII